MYKDILATLYGSLQSLEKCLENSKKMLAEQKDQPCLVWGTVEQQEGVLQHMRQVLNILQFEFARENWGGFSRQVKLFTGLQQMVRPEIINVFRALANHEVVMQVGEPNISTH